MLKSNLNLILKSKLTLFVFLILIIFTIIYTFYCIYNIFSNFTRDIINLEYLKDTPTASSSWEEFFLFDYSPFLFLLTPIVLSFAFSKKQSYIDTCEIHGNTNKQIIYQALSIGIVTAIIFFIQYFVALTTFYLTMGFNMPLWEIAIHNGEVTNYNSELLNSTNTFANDFFWLNNGNNTYLYFTIFGLFTTFLYFLYIMMSSIFALNFKGNHKVWAYIIHVYVFLFLSSILVNSFNGLVPDIINISYVFTIESNYYLPSVFILLSVYLLLILIYFGIHLLINKIYRREMNYEIDKES